MKLFSYYKKAVIFPSLFILFFCLVYSILDNSDFKSDWQTTKSLIIVSVVYSIIFSLLMHILSLTIFLNKIKKLNRNLIWNIVTWFLLPVGYIGSVLIHEITIRIKFGFGFGKDFIFLLIMTLPFIFGLCWTFIKYRQRLITADSLEVV
jgi:hypothetical protein